MQRFESCEGSACTHGWPRHLVKRWNIDGGFGGREGRGWGELLGLGVGWEGWREEEEGWGDDSHVCSSRGGDVGDSFRGGMKVDKHAQHHGGNGGGFCVPACVCTMVHPYCPLSRPQPSSSTLPPPPAIALLMLPAEAAQGTLVHSWPGDFSTRAASSIATTLNRQNLQVVERPQLQKQFSF